MFLGPTPDANVTLGVRNPRTDEEWSSAQRYPVIGNGPTICAGLWLPDRFGLEMVRLLAQLQLYATVVVIDDVLPGATAVGYPTIIRLPRTDKATSDLYS
jgi:hypothetical protein